MATPPSPVPSTTESSSTRSILIFSAVGLFAALIFGLLYLFVLAPSVPNGSLGWFLFSFATGLTMIVMPCTLPLAFVIVPLSMGKGMIRGLSMALAFGLGVAATLSLYGVAAALLGGLAIDALGADLEIIKNWVYFIAGSFALVFALSEIGLLNIHMPTYSGAAPAAIQKQGHIIKAFMLGLFLGNVGVGCPHPATPLILIEIASSGDVLYGWLLFLVHAVGRIIPLLLLAFLAILGVNGLNWLMTRKESVERVTGWAMVFVAGFILTLGLFSHDWWVNSGLHSGLEVITQEARFNAMLNETLDTNVAHVHGLEEGEGLFGLPLHWGNWFLVLAWLVPIWWWYRKRTKEVEQGSAMCDLKVLRLKRNFLIVISIFIVLTFTHFLPRNFYLAAISGEGHHDDGGHAHDDHGHSMIEGVHVMPDGSVMDGTGAVIPGAHVMPDGSIMLADGTVVGQVGKKMHSGDVYSQEVIGLPEANDPDTVVLSDGDSYDITAYYVQKEVGNRTLRMLSYNGSVPGPFLKAPQGAEITINFTNKTDLDQTIHSHGVRLDNNFDGVPGVTQPTVKPGESYTYTIDFPDAGVYWYHPHTRDDYGQEMGLYGNYLISPAEAYATPANREVPLVIDDILIENDKIVEFYKDLTNFALLGRFGNEFLVNGEQNYTMTAKAGEVIRFLVTNVSNARTYNLSMPGAELKLVAADVGQYEREEFISDVLISPAERIVVAAYFDKPGTYRLMHTMPSQSVELARVLVTDEAVATSYAEEFKVINTNESVVSEFADFRSYLDKEPDKRLKLTVDLMGGMVDHSMHAHGAGADEVDHSAHAHSAAGSDRLSTIQWEDPTQSDYVNTTRTVLWKLVDEQTGKVNMDIDGWTFKTGDLVKVRLTNDQNAAHVMQHPIHFHGQQFVVLAENGVPNNNLAWKDTVLVFPGEVVDILVDMSNPGEWMNHCHISEHLHAGMMMQFRVEDENGYAPGDEFRASLPPAPDGMSGHHMMPDPAQVVFPNSDQVFNFNTAVPAANYNLMVDRTTLQIGSVQQFSFSIFRTNGQPVKLSSDWKIPVGVTFVKSDGTERIRTYPGNTAFDNYVAPHGPAGHDNSDGHHGLGLWPVAYASGGDDHSHADTKDLMFTVPVVFEQKGIYRAFISFVPEGETEPVVKTLDIEVLSAGFSVDNYNWSPQTKRWILLIGSVLLMIPLVWFVRKYVNSDKV